MAEEPVLQNVKSYSIMRVSDGERELDLFTRRYEFDKKIHMFDMRTSGSHPYISERDVVNVIDLDKGVVKLPDGKERRSDLAKGDVIEIYKKGETEPLRLTYLRTL